MNFKTFPRFSFEFHQITWVGWSIYLGITCFFLISIFALRRTLSHRCLLFCTKQFKEKSLWYEKLECLRKPIEYLLILGGVRIALIILPLPRKTLFIFQKIIYFVFLTILLCLVSCLYQSLKNLIEKQQLISKASEEKKHQTNKGQTVWPFLLEILRALLIFFIICAALEGLGFPLRGILTTLGLGGAALAFAAKDSIANFFGSISLLVDAPFQIGDFIRAGGIEGTVESLGLRSTRIRTLDQTLITIPNNILYNEKIDNLSNRKLLRIQETIRLSYASNPQQIEAFVSALRELLTHDPEIAKESVRVYFTNFNESSLDISLIFLIKLDTSKDHLATRQRLNLIFMKIIEAYHLQISYPTQTIHLKQ